MSIDSQELNITGGVKVSGHVKSNFGVNFGVGTDSPSDAVHVAHVSPALAVQQQATSGGTVTSYGKVHADSGTLHIQSGVDATSDSKGDIVLGSVGSATKHVVVKGATSNVGIGTDDPAYGLDVVPSARFTGNVVASNLSANAITLAELSLEVTQGLDNVVNVDNTTGNTITMSNVTDSTSTSSGALTVAGGIGVGGNVHCSNLHASNITMNLFSFTGAQTFEQVVNTGRVLNSNVLIISNATPSTSASTGALTLTAGGLGVEGNVHVGSNLFVDSNLEVGTANLFVDTVTGNVGMGTTNPSHKFNVAADSGDAEVHIQAQGNAGDAIIYFNGSPTNQRKCAILSSNVAPASWCKQDLHFCHNTSGNYDDVTIDDSKMVITNAGNVGIGTTNPTSRFEVVGNETLQEYPPRAMTGYETYMEGHGVFKAYANSEQNGAAWKAFNKTDAQGEGWVTDTYEFIADTGYSNTSTATTNTVFGRCSFLAIETPSLIKLQRIRIQPDVNTSGAPDSHDLGMPKDFQIWARKSGTEWTQIASYTDQIFLYLTGSTEYYDINANDYYSEFAIVVTRTHTSSSYSWTSGTSQFLRGSIGEWRLFGTPAPSALEDGHLTLGKALTAPRVSGHPDGAETPRAESLLVHYDTTVDSVVSGDTVVDISGQGNNGTLVDNASYSSVDRALTFDTTSTTRVHVENTNGLPTGDAIYSISGWVKIPSSITTTCTLLSWGSQWGCSTMATLFISTSYELAAGIGCDSVRSTNAVITSNKWHYVAIVKKSTGVINASMFDLYVDGVAITNKSVNGGTRTQAIGSTTNLSVGGGFTGASSDAFNGSISNPKLWDVALTAEEVDAEYALGRTGKSINLTDTSLCLGGTAPRAQLDVRGTIWGTAARFGDGDTVNVADWGTTESTVSISTSSYETVPLSVHRGTTRADVPAIRIAVQDSLSATVGDYWRAIDFNTEDFRQCGINLINYNASGTGQFNLATRRDTGLGFSVSDYDGTNVLENALVVRAGGRLGIGTTDPFVPLHIKQQGDGYAASSNNGGIRFEREGNTNRWDIYHYSNGNLHFDYNGGGKAYVDEDLSGYTQMNFTGQHRTFIKDTPFTRAPDLEGLIVSANNNKYIKMTGGIEVGSNAITTNESLPVVSLSTKVNDKKCFGIISASEDPEERNDRCGNFVTPFEKELGDTRVYINSVGEGAMWVVNTAGPLESGDYVTTSNVAGYGQRQDDDVLHNYTVAKITMDCDFNPLDIPVQQILRSNVVETYYTAIVDEIEQEVDFEYPDAVERTRVTDKLENVLDEHGQLQWEDHPTETEKAYKIRYLDASGQQTDEANAVHVAAFVGCTYHCG
jgi:hypothetical protein